jgi:tripartite-type tricarboxylate transporter receptor subunit TctC
MHETRRGFLGGAALLGLAAPGLARAQSGWPNGPIRLVVPFPPGGSVDTLARLVQAHVQETLGVPMTIESRAGASGSVGTGSVARAAPDGQTFVLVFDTHAANPALIPNLNFDSRRDFTPIMQVGQAPMLLCTPNARPWQRLSDYIAAAKARPDTLTYGTVGVGSLAHLTMSLMQQAAGFKVVHVPYRGGAPMTAAAVAGEVDLALSTNAGFGGQVGQTIRAIAQSGPTRSPFFPDVPTVQENGVPGIGVTSWWGLLGPAGLPEPIVTRFHAAWAAALRLPAVQARLANPLGVQVVASSPAEFAAFLENQIETWGRVVREQGITQG